MHIFKGLWEVLWALLGRNATGLAFEGKTQLSEALVGKNTDFLSTVFILDDSKAQKHLYIHVVISQTIFKIFCTKNHFSMFRLQI